MGSVSFQVSSLRKDFNRRSIFPDVSFSLRERDSLVITGCNGAGKSTLLKVLAGVLSSTQGLINISIEGNEIHSIDRFQCIGFVSPYLQLYEEFTAWEMIELIRNIRGVGVSTEFLKELLNRVNLYERRDDFLRTYSSGMKQRMKYACALVHQPPILILDEPTANLDKEGSAIVLRIVQEQKERGIVVIATNDEEEIPWCGKRISLDAEQNALNNSQ